MAEGVIIDRATESDLPALVELFALLAEQHEDYHASFALRPDWRLRAAGHVRERLLAFDSLVSVARRGREVVGLVTAVLREPMLFAQSPRGLVENLMVRPSCRRGGIGRRLLEAAVVWCEARGAVVVEATVAAGNSEAAAFWRACGFEPVTTSMTRACRQGTDRG